MSAVPTSLAELRHANTQPSVSQLPAVRAGFNDLQGFELAQRAAKLLSVSDLVPQSFRGNLANCVVALEMAQRIGASALMVMQNLDIVHGRPTWRAQFVIACINQCGRFSALRYEWLGEEGKDSWGCQAWAIEKSTGEKLVGPRVTIGLAKKEKWYDKAGSKWQSIPQLMLMYRAGSWFGRTYAPELTMGLQTAEEARDVIDLNPDGSFAVTTEELARSQSPAALVEQSTLDGDPILDGPVLTFDEIMGRIHDTTDPDALDIISDEIGRVEDDRQRKELVAALRAQEDGIARRADQA